MSLFRPVTRRLLHLQPRSSFRMSLPRDVQEFLDGRVKSANIEFYRNSRRCQPDNLLIDELHDRWQGDYERLEYNHGFIQWLFPLQEMGMNYQSQPLQRHELDAMKSDPCDFYGMRLVDETTGRLARSLPPRNYATRYKNLVRSSHNNLRISRILKCLSEFGLERFNAGFLLHVLNEQSESDELNSGGIRSSMDRWWANCIRNEAERAWIGGAIAKARAGDVFTSELYEKALQRRVDTGRLDE
ncbi:opioid growth factor receptor conserved region-domain-containing protein [Mycena floridula]|nr:opioid growth factor receptor conserved region-domain-containing protein [Mycena floridula]